MHIAPEASGVTRTATAQVAAKKGATACSEAMLKRNHVAANTAPRAEKPNTTRQLFVSICLNNSLRSRPEGIHSNLLRAANRLALPHAMGPASKQRNPPQLSQFLLKAWTPVVNTMTTRTNSSHSSARENVLSR